MFTQNIKERMITLKKSLTFLIILILIICSLTGCSTNNKNSQDDDKKISIGSKDFTEAFLISEMYAQILEDCGFIVDRKFNLGGTPIAHNAVVNGDIDLYPEYTGTALMTVLKEEPISDEEKVLNTIRLKYSSDYSLAILAPAPMNNTQAIAVSKETAEKYNLKTLSDLSKAAADLTLGCPAEFKQREDGLKGLQNTYGGFNFKKVPTYDIGLRYKALTNKDIDSTVAFTTDGQIKTYNLVVLEDDKKLWPAYHAAPIIKQDVLDKYPEIEEILNSLNSKLTDEVMQELNWEVDGNKREYSEVAKEYLKNTNLIK